jgi:hypothetical protein
MEIPNKAIVTAAGPNMWPMLEEFALPTFEAYGEAQGYQVVTEKHTTDGRGYENSARAARWAKFGLLREALEVYETAVWLDADIIVCRTDDDIAQHVRPNNFQGFVLEQVPAERRINPNSGVWVMHQSDIAFDFLKAAEEVGIQPGPWTDQGAILKVLGWDRGDEKYHGARPGAGSPYLQQTAWLPVGWNQVYLGPRTRNPDAYVGRPSVPEPYAIHFMGMETTERHKAMAQTFGQLVLHSR